MKAVREHLHQSCCSHVDTVALMIRTIFCVLRTDGTGTKHSESRLHETINIKKGIILDSSKHVTFFR